MTKYNAIELFCVNYKKIGPNSFVRNLLPKLLY